MTTRQQAGARISEYVLDECVGCGSFAEVWRARHHVWADELVAIKLPAAPEYVRYLQREAVVVHALRHPNVVRVLGFDPYADTPYLVMELVRGPSLRGSLEKHARGLPLEAALTVLRGVLNAVAAAHASGVIHRDLKPGNVLLDLNGRDVRELRVEDVKVGDFGFGMQSADLLGSVAQSASLARDDQLVGTLAYLAPEVRDGGKRGDEKADLYAIGVMLFEMLTGERPAGAELPSTVRAETPRALDEIFQRLYTRYERRFESAKAVLAELDARLAKREARPVDARGLEPLDARPVRGSAARDVFGGAGRGVNADGSLGGRCQTCRHPVRSGDQFCTNCGEQLVRRVRRCPACHSFPGSEDRFCICCGVRLDTVEA